MLTKPEPEEILLKFYRSVRPQITGWKPVAGSLPRCRRPATWDSNLLSWVLGCFMVYLALFGLGHVLLGPFWEGAGLLAAVRDLRRRAVFEYLAQLGSGRSCECHPERS